jgi:hypothetical protein
MHGAAAGRWLGVLVLVCVAGGCAGDKATSLADRIRDGASRLAEADGSTVSVSFDPVATSPYSVALFPTRETEREVVAAGMNEAIAHSIYADMAYLGSMSNALVVQQDGQRLQFTSSWKHVAEVRDILVLPRKTGAATIELRREHGAVRVVAIR